MKFKATFSVVFASVACFATWLVTGEGSPFSAYFDNHLSFPNFVMKLQVVPYIAVMAIDPDTDFGEMLVAKVVEFVQWLLVGFLLATIVKGYYNRD